MITARIAADFVEEYATLLELSGASPFRVRAYANAVRALETLTSPLDELLAAGTLTEVKGIGDSVAELVAEFADTGTAQAYEKLRTATPEGLLDMLRIPGLGPRKIVAIRKALGIETLDALEQACRNGQLAALKGFGTKTQAAILKGVEFIRAHEGHCRVDSAHQSAQSLLAALRPHAQRIDIAGGPRRARETVQQLDFVISTTDAEAASATFADSPGNRRSPRTRRSTAVQRTASQPAHGLRRCLPRSPTLLHRQRGTPRRHCAPRPPSAD